MEDKPKASSAINLVVVLGTVAAGAVLLRGRIDSPRPSTPSQQVSQSGPSDQHRVPARLWQDPFEAFAVSPNQSNGIPAVSVWQLALNESGPTLSPLKTPSSERVESRELGREIEDKTLLLGSKIAILGVMLPGGPYAGDQEVRRRLRFAVEMALLTKNVGPVDNEHISTNWMALADEITNNPASTRFAYEWFTLDTNQLMQTCVLWLNESDFAADFWPRLGCVLDQLRTTGSPTNLSVPTNLWFYLIGPRSSDSLRSLVHANTSSPIFQNRLVKAGQFQILSPEATAAVTGKDDPFNIRLSVALKAKFCGNFFHNWIASDQRMAELLADEIQNRKGAPSLNDGNVVAVITEQDSFYGRTLADALTTELARMPICGSSNNVWKFSYLRGLDGSKPQREKHHEQRQPTATTPELALEAVLQQQEESEKADGDAQLDYIVRLGELLKKKDEELQAEHPAHRIVAVGLTGSDVYDKLMLLRGLRHELPEAIFFTTDLDASLGTAGQLKCSLNLLIASAYSIAPGPDQEFPPFRDVYQRAVFAACQAVVDHQKDGSLKHLHTRIRDLLGGLYKIGRNGPVPLTHSADSTGKLNIVLAPGCGFIYGTSLMFLVALVAGFWMPDRLQNVSPGVQGASQPEHKMGIPWWVIPVGGIIGLIFGAFLLLTKWVSRFSGEEPWDLLSGVSIWPCELIRVIVIIGGILFLAYAYRDHQLHRKRLWLEYFGKDREPPEQSWNSFWNAWDKCGKLLRRRMLLRRQDWDQFWEQHFPPPPGVPTAPFRESPFFINKWRLPLVNDPAIDPNEPVIDAETLFKGYLRRGLWNIRFTLSLAKAISYFALLFLASSLTGSTPPLLLIRGPISHSLDFLVLMCAVLVSSVVLFYVLDSARLTARVLDAISLHPTRWPRQLLREKSELLGIQQKHLDGWIDVDFAVVKTGEFGCLMFAPFFFLFLLFISRCSLFDTWTWPTVLITIFVINFLLAMTCWAVVRSAAAKVRQLALSRLERSIATVEHSADRVFTVPAPGGLTVRLTKERYARRLTELYDQVRSEVRGAYAPWFQDPSYVGVFIPTGITGVITVIAQFWLNR